MNSIAHKILLIEDNAGDARLVDEFLSEAPGARFDLKWANRLEIGLDSLREDRFDVVLLDLELPDSVGLPTVERVLKTAPEIPVVVMTSLDDEALAMAAVQSGAQDYLVKGFLESSILIKSINYAIERKRAQEKIRESELLYRTLFEQSPDGVLIIDPETALPIEFNDIACLQLGYSRDEFAALRISDYEAVETPEETGLHMENVLLRGHDTFETRHRAKNGELRNMRVSVQLVEFANRKAFYCIVRDVTRQKQAENALAAAVNQSRRRWKETDALLAATRSVLENQDFQQAARPIFNACKELIGATSGYVALLNEQGNENDVLFLDPGGLSCSVDPGLPMPIRGLRSIAYSTGSPVFENSFSETDFVEMMPDGHVGLDSVLFAPLMIKDKPAGLLGVANKPGGFDDNDARLTGAFAELMSVALANSQAYTSLEKSEERFRSITASASDAVISADDRGVIATWNDGARDMFGYSAEEAVGQPLSVLMPERFRDRHMEGIAGFLATGEPRIMGDSVELMALRKDGSEFPIELSLSTWKTSEATYFGSIIRDITERRRMFEQIEERRLHTEELALQLARERDTLEITMENSPQAHLVYLDRDFNFLMANSSYCEGCRKSKEELIGKNHFDLFPHEENEAIFKQVRDTGEPVEFREKPFEFPDEPWRGTTYWDWTLTPVKESQGEVQGLVFSLVDVTGQVLSRRYSEALNNISVILNSSLDFDEIMNEAMGAAASTLESESAFLATEDDGGYVFRYTSGMSGDTPAGSRMTPDNAPVAALSLQQKKTIFISDSSSDDRIDPAVAKKLSILSAISTPIYSKQKIVGIMAFRFHSRKKEFSDPQVDFVEKFATLVGMALENASLYQMEKETRATVQGYAVQMGILHDIGLSLNRESDLRKLQKMTLKNAARLTSAGLCLMTQLADGVPALASVYHAPWYHRQLFSLEDVAPMLHHRLVEMMSDSDQYAFRVYDLKKLDWFPETHLDVRELLVGVLRDTRGRIRNLFVLGDKADNSSFNKTDEEVISLLAAQSSVAFISAENFEKEHYVAETLQTCLMPEIPARDDIEIGLLYRSASKVSRIGGDFYDVTELGPNTVAIAVGDVCGKGLSAASHTAMVKFMLRAYLEEGRPPGECLSLLNTALCSNLAPDKFITLGLIVIDMARGELSYSLAGHPLPLISRESHPVELDVPNTIPLGVIPGYSFSSMETHFTAETTILMYTDGVIEAKSPDGEQFGHRRLKTEFGSQSALSAQHMAQKLVERVLEFSEGNLNDDVALMVARPTKMSPEGSAPDIGD